MRTDFFEEFPTQENLNKAKLIKFPSTVYIAAKSFDEFRVFEKRLHKINPKLEAGYWPILEKSYWISPFSYTFELKKLIIDLKNKKLKVMLDLELPFLDKKLFFTNLFSFFKNKKLIKEIFQNPNLDILTAEYPVSNKLSQKILGLLGISYRYPHKKIIMFYSSMINRFRYNQIKKNIMKRSKQNLQIGLGTIAKGILGDEPILSPKDLGRDLDFLKRAGVKTAVIFRFGGLNKEYIKQF